MTKKKIVQSISEDLDLTQRQTQAIVEKVFDGIVRTLVEERRVELRNFGVFEVVKRASRKARNPRTGEKVDVPERFTVKFTAGQVVQKQVTDARTGGDPAEGDSGEASVAQAGTDR